MSGIAKWEKKSSKKGWKAFAGASGSVLAAVYLTPYLLFIGVPLTAIWTVDWFKYRAKRGMRF